jgi:hypothetical protein
MFLLFITFKFLAYSGIAMKLTPTVCYAQVAVSTASRNGVN